MKLTTYIHLVFRLRMNGAIPPLPLHKFMACTGTTLLFSFVTFFTLININKITLQKPTETHAGLLDFIQN